MASMIYNNFKLDFKLRKTTVVQFKKQFGNTV